MDIELVKELRGRTHVGLSECKTALEEAKGDLNEAVIILQKRGALRADAVADKTTTKGRIFSYNHNGGIVGVVEVSCETDFAAKSEPFIEFGEKLAMQVVAMNPTYLRREDIPVETWSTQMAIFAEATRTVGMKDEVLTRIVNGKMINWVSVICLMEQPAVTSDAKKTFEELRTALVAMLGENVTVQRFLRWQLTAPPHTPTWSTTRAA